jgi:Cof subfamily protein (haloacid dehalogenase superfamily)
VTPNGELTDTAVATIARSRAAGIPVVVATGRMFRSVRPYLERAGIDDLVVCYQGAAVVDPRDGTFVVHEPIALDVAREAVAALLELGYPPNVYVDDELVVAQQTRYSQAYAGFQHLPVSEVGDLLAWLERPPTKLVAVGEPDELPALRAAMEERFDGRLFLTTSLPWLLELGRPGTSKGSGILYVAGRLGVDTADVVAFGDGENDVELLEEAGFGVAVEGAHERLLAVADWTCPGPETDGVARVIDAYLDSRA